MIFILWFVTDWFTTMGKNTKGIQCNLFLFMKSQRMQDRKFKIWDFRREIRIIKTGIWEEIFDKKDWQRRENWYIWWSIRKRFFNYWGFVEKKSFFVFGPAENGASPARFGLDSWKKLRVRELKHLWFLICDLQFIRGIQKKYIRWPWISPGFPANYQKVSVWILQQWVYKRWYIWYNLMVKRNDYHFTYRKRLLSWRR